LEGSSSFPRRAAAGAGAGGAGAGTMKSMVKNMGM